MAQYRRPTEDVIALSVPIGYTEVDLLANNLGQESFGRHNWLPNRNKHSPGLVEPDDAKHAHLFLERILKHGSSEGSDVRT